MCISNETYWGLNNIDNILQITYSNGFLLNEMCSPGHNGGQENFLDRHQAITSLLGLIP